MILNDYLFSLSIIILISLIKLWTLLFFASQRYVSYS